MPYCENCGSPVEDADERCRACHETIAPLIDNQAGSSAAGSGVPVGLNGVEPLPVAPLAAVLSTASPADVAWDQPVVPPLSSSAAGDGSALTPPADPSLSASATGPLRLPIVGDLVAGRIRLVTLEEQADDRIRFEAEDEQRCAHCGEEGAHRDWCDECGAPWLPTRCRVVALSPTCVPPEDQEITFVEGNLRFIVQYAPPNWAVPAPSVGASPALGAPEIGRSIDVLLVGQASDTGKVREKDEDAIFCMTLTRICEGATVPVAGLFIVADGMGGTNAGEVASRLAVDAIAQRIARDIWPVLITGETPDESVLLRALAQAMQDAHSRILEQERLTGQTMGSTATFALVVNQQAYIANVGDSRTYLLRQGNLIRISRDHSLVAQLVEQGKIAPLEVYTHPERNVILRCLGIGTDGPPLIETDTFVQPMQAGDRLILCCDGLWEMVRDPQIAEITTQLPVQEACEALIATANSNGGDDNISVIVVAAA